MKLFQSVAQKNHTNQLSCWDEPVKPIATNPSVSHLQLQFIGVIIILALVLATSISLTFVITGIKPVTTNAMNSNTSSLSTSSVTTITTTITTTANPYGCSTMTFYNGTDFPGNDISLVSPMNFTSCCLYCLNVSGCVVFSLVLTTNTCYAKSSIGSGGISVTQIISAKF